MARIFPSLKRIQINKANARIVTAIAGTAFVVVFCMVASKALLDQRAYQNKIITAKSKAVTQLQENISATQTLATAYTEFTNRPENVIGGSSSGNGTSDGDNARIILNALPSKYDFPALITSLDRLLRVPGADIRGITGTDDEINQQNAQSPNPLPIEIPFQASVSGNYGAINRIIDNLQRSIRPIQIQSLNLTGTSGAVQATVQAKTFYQPGKSLTITKEEVK